MVNARLIKEIIILCFLLLYINLLLFMNLINSYFSVGSSAIFCVLSFQGPPTDAPAVDTAEQVYISSLALLKVITSIIMKPNLM